MPDYQLLRQNLSAVIRQAGQIILNAHNSPIHKKSGHYNLVTDTDVAVQEFLREKLSALVPESRFFSEEQENAELTSAPTWIVDPVDGTTNFTRNRRCSCISIAFMVDAQPQLGMIYQPYSDEIFSAVRGTGAFLNDAPIHVSDNAFENALISMGTSPYYENLRDATAYCVRTILERSGDIRRCGSAALDLCDVACGRSDAFFEMLLSPWDFSAGALIVTEAGGTFEMPMQSALDFGHPAAIMASNAPCLAPMEKVMAEARQLIHS